jgi:hypothetical protein
VGFEFRASCWLGRHSYTRVMALAFFASVIFLIESHVFAHAGLDYNLPIYASCMGRMTSLCHHI